MNSTEKIFKSLNHWGEHPVYIEISSGKNPTYITAPQFKERISYFIQLFTRLDLGKKFIAALFLKNSADFPAIFLSLMHIGAVPVPLKLEYRKLELDEIFSNADPHVIITEEDHLPILADYMKSRIVITKSKNDFKIYQKPVMALLPDPPAINDSIASINYTYRGLGYPLGAMVPDSQYFWGAKVLQEGIQYSSANRLLLTLPMTHIYTLVGCIFLPLLFGVTLVIHNTLKPTALFKTIQDFKINYLISVPEIYNLLIKFLGEKFDFSSLKGMVSGGSFLNAANLEKIRKDFNTELLHGYGLTEFTPVSVNISKNARSDTIGPVCDGIDFKLNPLEKNTGELLIKSDYMTKSYYKRANETKDAFQSNWFKTGDICRQDKGHLVFIKEKKKTCKVNGVMIDLEEVKRGLLHCEKIKEAYIFYNNNKLFARVKVASAWQPKTAVLEIKNFLAGVMGGYKIPALVYE